MPRPLRTWAQQWDLPTLSDALTQISQGHASVAVRLALLRDNV